MAAPTYRHGAFVWFTHLADHAGDAMSFYSEVFGWREWKAPAPATDRQMPPVDLRPAKDSGPGWVSWLSVADVSASERRAKALGATVLQTARDAPVRSNRHQTAPGLDAECFALIEDPGGARFFLVTAAHGDPEPSPSRAGEIFTTELWAQNVEEASTFYCELVGYERLPGDDGGRVAVLALNGEPVASVVGAPCAFLTRSAVTRAPASSQWLPYVVTTDVDTTVARARRIGGSLVGDIVETPDGARSAVLLDHGGQAIATIAPAGI